MLTTPQVETSEPAPVAPRYEAARARPMMPGMQLPANPSELRRGVKAVALGALLGSVLVLLARRRRAA